MRMVQVRFCCATVIWPATVTSRELPFRFEGSAFEYSPNHGISQSEIPGGVVPAGRVLAAWAPFPGLHVTVDPQPVAKFRSADAVERRAKAQEPLPPLHHHRVPQLTAWLPQPCRWSCLSEAFMQYEGGAGAAPG